VEAYCKSSWDESWPYESIACDSSTGLDPTYIEDSYSIVSHTVSHCTHMCIHIGIWLYIGIGPYLDIPITYFTYNEWGFASWLGLRGHSSGSRGSRLAREGSNRYTWLRRLFHIPTLHLGGTLAGRGRKELLLPWRCWRHAHVHVHEHEHDSDKKRNRILKISETYSLLGLGRAVRD
jgi:hypothetical protein